MALAAPELFSTGTQPGLSPAVKLDKGGGGGGGFGSDLLSAAAGALGAAQPDPLTDALSSAFVHLLAAPGLSTCRLRFLPRSDFPALVPGDTLTLKLGDGAAAPAAVFTGTVARASTGNGALDVLLAGPAAKLGRRRLNAGYENQGFADLLKAWAAEAGIDTSRIDQGPDYAFFAIDDRLSLWDWVARVARHADVPAWVDATGALKAAKPAGQPVATFTHGQNLLALDTHARDPVITGGRIVGEGSAGRQGSDAWAWLAKDPQGVSAGGAAGGAVEQEGGLRDLASVAAAALGAAAGAARLADAVEVRVPGTAALDIASVFELANCPGGEGNGRWAVSELRHRFSTGAGFVTEIVGLRLS